MSYSYNYISLKIIFVKFERERWLLLLFFFYNMCIWKIYLFENILILKIIA